MLVPASAEYAVRAMVHLAGYPAGSVVSIGKIAKAWRIPDSFLRKIMAPLDRAGLVESRRGVGGGVFLRRSASSITALEVIEAVVGGIEVNECVNSPVECDLASTCRLRPLWSEAQQKLREVFGNHSIAELAGGPPRAGSHPGKNSNQY